MPKSRTGSREARDLELAARFVATLYGLTGGRLGRFRRLDQVAERAGIAGADVDRALATAELAGFVDRHGEDARMVGLTPRGVAASRP